MNMFVSRTMREPSYRFVGEALASSLETDLRSQIDSTVSQEIAWRTARSTKRDRSPFLPPVVQGSSERDGLFRSRSRDSIESSDALVDDMRICILYRIRG